MTIQVYCDPVTVNSRKVLAGLEQMKADYNQNYINYFTGQHRSAEYKKINPHATVPSATDGDLTITESNAILQYAADVSRAESMYPKDLKRRAVINQWLLWEGCQWFPSCYIYLVEYVVKPLSQAEPDQNIIDGESERFNKLAEILNDQLSKTKWLTGDDVTIADFAVAAPMQLHEASRFPLEKYPHLRRWMIEGMEQLDSWKKTQGPPDVRTTVNYTQALDQLTALYFYETEKAKCIHEPGDSPVEISVSDGWLRANNFTLDNNGFALHNFKAKHDGWEDDQTVRDQFYAEVVDLLKKELGAKRVLVFDHTICTESNAKKALTDEKFTSQRSPVMLVHCDYTAEPGPLRVQHLLGDEAEDLLKRRVASNNVWKPINRVVEERPLAICDVQSCEDSDFFKLHLRYRERNGENYMMKHSPKHIRYYFPKMTPEQVIHLKVRIEEIVPWTALTERNIHMIPPPMLLASWSIPHLKT